MPVKEIAAANDNDDDTLEEKRVLLHLTPHYQTSSVTTLSLYYVSSIDAIDMIGVALLGTNAHRTPTVELPPHLE